MSNRFKVQVKKNNYQQNTYQNSTKVKVECRLETQQNIGKFCQLNKCAFPLN